MMSKLNELRSRSWIFLLVIVLTWAWLGASAVQAEEKELHMYCGAGLRQPVDELLADFMKETGWKVTVEFGGSGQQLTRFQATGVGDVFLPGSHFYVDKLEAAGQVTSRRPVVLHIPVVAFTRDKSDRIKTFADLAKPGLRVGLGDPQAMALGRTAEQILDNSGLREAILKNVVTRASTVKQLTLYVLQGDVDAAIIARADVFQNQKVLAFLEIDPNWFSPEVVTVATLKTAADPAAAQKLADYLSSEKAVEVFGRYGFLPVR